ncbi:MAG: translation initiation factor IF-2 [Pseudomonadota bacterium]|nr:translation initiation factor IF-2 [Pseudomonadota bacterium]
MILREKKKTKVYELSRTLKLKEPELLTILETLKIEVSTKFSPLSDEDVDRVKVWCQQNQGPDLVEKRVGSGVRRRRRKVVEKPVAEPEELISSEPESEVVEPTAIELVEEAKAESLAVDDLPTVEEPVAKITEPVVSDVEVAAAVETAPAEAVTEVTEAQTEAKTKAPKKSVAGADARIISRVEPEVEPEAVSDQESTKEVSEEGVSIADESVAAEAPVVTEPVISEKDSLAEVKAEVVQSDSDEVEKVVVVEKSGKSGKTGPRGARVIGRVALSDLGARPDVRPPRSKSKRKAADAAPSKYAPAAGAPAAAGTPGPVAEKEVSGKKGRKSRKKDGAQTAADNGTPSTENRSRRGSRRSVIKNLNFSDDRGGKGRRGRAAKKRGGQKTEITMPKQIKRVVKITDVISVGELAKKMGVKAGEVIGKLMIMGSMVTINQMVDFDTAVLVAEEFGHTVENVAFDEELVLEQVVDNPEDLVNRPPVVTIMGHVDHGKTSLLDAIRQAQVADGEAGGITQHIGAYMVSLPKGDISFVDTPGHEAFTSMRSRGAGVTDIVILVVAADDGVMPTTIESINHAKAADVPIIVAINKIDKENARPDEVRRQLSEHGLLSEDWGGETIFVEVSAKQRLNLDTLLEMVLLQAEMMEITANPDKVASGVVLESRLDRGKGPVATVLVQDGTVKAGDFIVAGLYSGRVRALLNDKGEQIESAGPSTPVAILGLSGVPSAGDDFNVVKSEKQAKELTSNRQHKAREQEISKTSKISLEDLFEQMEEGEVEQLNVIVKGDVQGSVEAVAEALRKQATAKVKVDVVHAAVGGVKEADVMLAAASQAIIVGFNVRPDLKAQHLAEQESVDIRLYSVIYDLLEDLRLAMEGLLAPEMREVYMGRAEVRQAFMVSKVGTIAGCRVVDGKIKRNAQIRLLRDDIVIVEGKISSLKRFKDDAKEVASGFECGIGIENYNDVKAGDVIEAFEIEEIAAKL